MPINQVKQIILNLPRGVKRWVVLWLDVLICYLSVWLTFLLRLDQWWGLEGNQWWVLIISIIFSITLFIVFGLYRAIFRYIGSKALSSMVQVFILYAIGIFILFTLIGFDGVPRSIGIIQPALLFIGVGSSRYFVRHWLGDSIKMGSVFAIPKPYALIYGAGSAGRQLAAGLSASQEIQVQGFIDDDPFLQKNTINGVTIYGFDDLHSLIVELHITDVLLALPTLHQNRRNEIIAALKDYGVRVRTIPALVDMASGLVRISDLRDLDMNDLLGRPLISPNEFLLKKNIHNKVVLVTGAGGSIGSELCRQIINFSPKALILVDSSEYNLYVLEQELKRAILQRLNQGSEDGFNLSKFKLAACLTSVRDWEQMTKLFTAYHPDTVFHAAAYKHVPLVEKNPAEGIRNNVLGTLTCAQLSLAHHVSSFTLISTDKAVRPTNIMGASKRLAELVLQAMAEISKKENLATQFSIVRFGNVLGSSGSVAPLFSSQIKAGGPITLTHPEVTRYFMTIPEAAQLVIQASAMTLGGDVFVLDMGEPVRIYDLALRMIYLSGLILKDKAHPHGDIEIKVTGLRPGEKLYEELLIGDSPQATDHPKIMKAHEEFISWDELDVQLKKLNQALQASDSVLIRQLLTQLVPGYQPNGDSVDWSGGEDYLSRP